MLISIPISIILCVFDKLYIDSRRKTYIVMNTPNMKIHEAETNTKMGLKY